MKTIVNGVVQRSLPLKGFTSVMQSSEATKFITQITELGILTLRLPESFLPNKASQKVLASLLV
jgi:hypothetical protein